MDFRNQPMLAGETVCLEPYGLQHVDAIFEGLADPESRRLTGTHATFTRADVVAFTENVTHQDDRADWAIVRRSDHVFVGVIVLNQFDADNASASLRIDIGSPRNRGRGYGTEAIRLVLPYAFDVVGLHRISLEVYAFNPRAQHVYEKCGFRVEGRLRESLRWDGEWHDAIVMSVLATER